ncbi:hypothetical protein MAR_016456 [Mya arenaria]|uniref:Adipokinetic hormone n=1 Tax=Mya arenaria TaxID=6604 RepID=A0ABY7FN59_MYAAR|nr:hypothetical protein MAR_016456 [Mya arenaria]
MLACKKMRHSTILLLVLACMFQQVVGQVSFSTHWGTGKRSPLFDTQAQPITAMLNVNSNLFDCLGKVKLNSLRYMALILEKELQQARECILAEKEADYE